MHLQKETKNDKINVNFFTHQYVKYFTLKFYENFEDVKFTNMIRKTSWQIQVIMKIAYYQYKKDWWKLFKNLDVNTLENFEWVRGSWCYSI